MPFTPFIAGTTNTVAHPLDLNTLLVPHPAATYFFKVEGNSMQDLGVFDQDILIIDRSLMPQNGDIVLISNECNFHLKTFQKKGEKITLYSANQKILPIEINKNLSIEILGVATANIHPFTPLKML